MAKLTGQTRNSPDGICFWPCEYDRGLEGLVGYRTDGLLYLASWVTELTVKKLSNHRGIKRYADDPRTITTCTMQSTPGVYTREDRTNLRELGFVSPDTIGRVSLQIVARTKNTAPESIIWQAASPAAPQATVSVYGPNVGSIAHLADAVGMSSVAGELPELFNRIPPPSRQA